LADFGEHLREAGKLGLFHALLFAEIGVDACSIEGLRFKESIEALTGGGRRARTVFLECAGDIRHKRLGASRNDTEFVILQDQGTELSVEEMRSDADLIVDASVPADAVLQKTRRALRQWRMI